VLQSMRSAAKYIWIFIVIFFVVGFILLDTSGLLGTNRVTTSTAVATVNGRDILYTTWSNASQNLIEQQQERLGRSLSGDEIQQIRQQAFDELVEGILLDQELKRRGIRVTDDEIREAARYTPLPELRQNPELQTEGQFDPAKYQRFLASPTARQGGLLRYLEQRYRSEIPRQKLFEQVASSVYVPDERLWRIWQDQHDSAQVSFVAFLPTGSDTSAAVSDEELKRYYDRHKETFERPGRAIISVVHIPRVITAADTAAARNRAMALRAEILGGVKFDSVAARESADTVSGQNGGSLGRGGPGRFVADFEKAAYGLKLGEISQPVLTNFGYHLIKVDEHKGDTLALRHILVRIAQSDSSAVVTDRRADSLSNLAAAATTPAKFDSAARRLGLPVSRAAVIEGEPATVGGRYVPGASAFAFGGARRGETSELLDSEEGYALVRLDSLVPGGVPSFAEMKTEVRAAVRREKAIAALLPKARELAQRASTTSLEQAAEAQGLTVHKGGPFTRVGFVPGMGRLNEAIGASFGLPVGAVSAPITTNDGVFVIRVDRRVNADRAAFEAQKSTQRQQLTQALRRQEVQEFLTNLRKSAKIKDRRKELNAAARVVES
jgi:peptidyl-prolyl cis-trans isomerase D